MYFITPDYSVAFNAKVASSTLSRAIIAAFHPEQESLLQTACYPEGKGPDSVHTHWLCPKEARPSRPVVLIVREPVDRFRTAMAQFGLTDVEAVLESLENGIEVPLPRRKRNLRHDTHFRHQYPLLGDGMAFRLEDIDTAAELIGLSLPLPVINEASRPKPVLTQEQEERVLAYYAADAELYDSLQ